jgi:hypothetical protein
LFAGIFEGEQIEAKEGGGKAGTIDVMLKTADGTKGYSFKLLSPRGGIKGSFTDLITGIEEHKAETYLVVIKRGKAGSTLDLDFWEFEITQENWFDWIGHAKLEETGEETGVYEQKMQYVINAQEFKPEAVNLEEEIVVGNNTKFRKALSNVTANKTKDWSLAPLSSFIEVTELEDGKREYRATTPQGATTNLFDGMGAKIKKGSVLEPGRAYFYNKIVGKRPVRVAKFGKAASGLYRELILPGPKQEKFEIEHDGMTFVDYVNTGKYKTDPKFWELHYTLDTVKEAEKEEDKPTNEAMARPMWERLCESFFEEGDTPLLEAKGKEAKVTAGQFEIDPNFMIRSGLANPQYGGKPVTLTLDRKLLTAAAKGYTGVISQQVFDIFNSLSELIKDINLFYLSKNVSERNNAGEDAGEQAGELKKNTDEHIVASVKQSSPEEEVEFTESRRPISLDKLINEALKDIFA